MGSGEVGFRWGERQDGKMKNGATATEESKREERSGEREEKRVTGNILNKNKSKQLR